jgi:DNA polymerase III delta prime subunit
MLFELEEQNIQNQNTQKSLDLSSSREISKFHQSVKISNLHHAILLPNIYQFFQPILDDLIYSIGGENVEKFELSANENGNILIESLIECTSFVQKTSFYKTKIIIIHKVCSLSLTVANALLKILEEPPKDTIFLLTFNKKDLILPTIKSRALYLDFSNSEENFNFIYSNFIKNEIPLDELKKIINNDINLLYLFRDPVAFEAINSFEKLLTEFSYNNFKIFFNASIKQNNFKELMYLILESKIHNLKQEKAVNLFNSFIYYKKNTIIYNTSFELFLYHFTKKICYAKE